jgi:peptidoglycan lytic transglycosylase
MELVLRTSKRLAMMAVVVLSLVRSGVALEKGSGNKRALDTQIGDATFYAARFEGRKTASGQIYERDRAIAAHRTYPFGTVVRVTCLGNKRSANVVIVDRGPYGKNRREGAIIDVSQVIAKKLGIIKRGQARVRLEVLVWGTGD